MEGGDLASDLGLEGDTEALVRARSVGVYLGSFDPPHRGHEFIAGELSRRCEAVLLLLPAWHFHKVVRPGLNASLDQRLEMLALARGRLGARLVCGCTREVLFVRLRRLLADRLPGAQLSLAMGNETFERVRDSRRTFERCGFSWTAREEKQLAATVQDALVFGRTAAPAGCVAVPKDLRAISSTKVRGTVATLHGEHAAAAEWERRLAPMLSAGVARYVRENGLYRGARPSSTAGSSESVERRRQSASV
jgi:cytidyltransferase-like protein